MSSITGLNDEELDNTRRNRAISDPSRVTLSEIDPREENAIRRTRTLLSHLIPPIPSSMDAPLTGRATVGPVERIAGPQNAAQEAHDPNIVLQAVTEHPNLAWEAIKVGLLKEKITNDQLNAHIKEAEKHQKDIDLLLDFNSEMAGFKDDATELSQRAKELLEELKARGIDLWKGEDRTVNKERVSSMKELSSNHIDKSRSKLQNLVLTKIQPKIANIGAIMETLKDIIRNNTKLMNTITANTGKR